MRGKFLTARKSHQMKFLTKNAKEFLNSVVVQVLVFVEARIIQQGIQNILREKDGHNLQGNSFTLFAYKYLRHLILSIDNCDNTGDHENFFDDSTDAYEIDGTKYTNCMKQAVRYRSKYEHKLISHLTEVVFFLFDGLKYTHVNEKKLSNQKEMFNPELS